MTKRSTVNVSYVKEKANYFLEHSDDSQSEQRKGTAGMLEAVLFETDNYKGFSLLSSEWDNAKWALRDGYDDTRRRYF
jgi:hypothetical protein